MELTTSTKLCQVRKTLLELQKTTLILICNDTCQPWHDVTASWQNSAYTEFLHAFREARIVSRFILNSSAITASNERQAPQGQCFQLAIVRCVILSRTTRCFRIVAIAQEQLAAPHFFTCFAHSLASVLLSYLESFLLPEASSDYKSQKYDTIHYSL